MVEAATDTRVAVRKEMIWAYNALMDRAVGRPMKDESELEALRQGGVRIQIVNVPGHPDNDNSGPLAPTIGVNPPRVIDSDGEPHP